MTDTTDPQTAEPGICPNCQHPQHLPGTECDARINHGPRRFHACLCLARPGAALPCPPQMTCQGGTLGYSDIWYLQQGHSLSSADGVISPEVLTVGPVAVGFPSAEAACSDPIECSHEAALGEAQQEVRRLGLMVDEYSAGASALTDKLHRARDMHRETCPLARGGVQPPAFRCGMCEVLDAPAVLPPAADRAAVLREAADKFADDVWRCRPEDPRHPGLCETVQGLRRMADVAQYGDDCEMAASWRRDGFGEDEIAGMLRRGAAGERDEQQAQGDLIEDYLRFLRGQGPEPDLTQLPPADREVIARQFEIVKALADRDPELPPLDLDPVARRLGLHQPAAAPVAGQPPADTGEEAREEIECAHCWRLIANRGTPNMGGPSRDNWVHVPGGFQPCFPQRGSDSPRAEPLPAVAAEPGKENSRG